MRLLTHSPWRINLSRTKTNGTIKSPVGHVLKQINEALKSVMRQRKAADGQTAAAAQAEGEKV